MRTSKLFLSSHDHESYKDEIDGFDHDEIDGCDHDEIASDHKILRDQSTDVMTMTIRSMDMITMMWTNLIMIRCDHDDIDGCDRHDHCSLRDQSTDVIMLW